MDLPRAAIFNFFHFVVHQTTKILQYIKNTFFANLTKNRYNFDSFTPNNYCCVVCYHFFIWKSKGKEVPCPWLNRYYVFKKNFFPMDMGFIWEMLGEEREELELIGTWQDRLLNLLFNWVHVAWRLGWVRTAVEVRGEEKGKSWNGHFR